MYIFNYLLLRGPAEGGEGRGAGLLEIHLDGGGGGEEALRGVVDDAVAVIEL